jgi:hypothetical protein
MSEIIQFQFASFNTLPVEIPQLKACLDDIDQVFRKHGIILEPPVIDDGQTAWKIRPFNQDFLGEFAAQVASQIECTSYHKVPWLLVALEEAERKYKSVREKSVARSQQLSAERLVKEGLMIGDKRFKVVLLEEKVV